MKTAKDYARILLAGFCLSCNGAPALANFAMSPSGATTLFAVDAANQGTSLCAAASTECAASVPINTAGAPLFVTANPGVVSQATAASLNATVVGTGTFAAQLTGATNNINNIAGTISLPTGAATSTKQSDGTQKSQIVDGSGNVIASTSNNLNVQCANCSGAGVSAADAATFTAGTSLMAPAGGQFTSGGATACVTGHECTVGITAARAFLTDLSSQAGVAITSSPSAYGTAPTGNVIGVNSFVTGSIPEGAVGDTAWVSGNGSIIALLKAAVNGINSSIAAGGADIGSVGLSVHATGGCTPGRVLSAASTNSTNIKPSAAGTLCSLTVVNNTATAADLRLYDAAAAPTCSSATGVVANFGIQANTTTPGISPNFGAYGLAFTNGIGFCLTAYDGTDTNNSASVTGIQVNYAFK